MTIIERSQFKKQVVKAVIEELSSYPDKENGVKALIRSYSKLAKDSKANHDKGYTIGLEFLKSL
jgi:hypothetical protein